MTISKEQVLGNFMTKAENTVFIKAGPITFGVEYRILNIRDENGNKTDVVMDHGVCLHVFDGDPEPENERLRFDCFHVGPHYHYDMLNSDQHNFIDMAANGDPLKWALERLRTRLPSLLIRTGAPELARKVNQSEIDMAIPQLITWSDIIREQAMVNFEAPVYMIGAKAAGEYSKEGYMSPLKKLRELEAKKEQGSKN